MRILVTADIHLSAEHPERQEALKDVIRIAEEEDVRYLLIAGDMFDAGVDIEEVKTGIRDLFSGNDFRTFVIPGRKRNALVVNSMNWSRSGKSSGPSSGTESNRKLRLSALVNLGRDITTAIRSDRAAITCRSDFTPGKASCVSTSS